MGALRMAWGMLGAAMALSWLLSAGSCTDIVTTKQFACAQSEDCLSGYECLLSGAHGGQRLCVAEAASTAFVGGGWLWMAERGWACTGAFEIDLAEVSWADYASVQGLADPSGVSVNECDASQDDPQHPVRCVSWHEARGHCQMRGFELCTEVQWKMAAGGSQEYLCAGDTPLWPTGCICTDDEGSGLYPWGVDRSEVFCDKVVYRDNAPEGCGHDGPVHVRDDAFSGGRSPFGLWHMAGNVREWSRACESSPLGEPECAPDAPRIVFGGSYAKAWDEVQVHGGADLDLVQIDQRQLGIGFRCCRSIESASCGAEPPEGSCGL